MGHGHLVIDRKQWGAASTIGLDNLSLEHPISRVIITHVGEQSKPCDNVYNCSIKMRTIQDSAIAEKMIPDMPANFYVSLLNIQNEKGTLRGRTLSSNQIMEMR